MTLIPEPVSTFTGADGTEHRIGYLTACSNAGQLLVDEWAGRGVRLLALLSSRDAETGLDASRRDGSTFLSSVATQAEALIREYRAEATTADRPLSRRVTREDIAHIPALSA